MKKVGFFSGTFDPVHNGHLTFARQALEAGELDKLFFMVEPRPRRKQGVKAYEHRLNMVQLAIKDEPAFGTIVLEQQRFTADKTLPILEARFQGAELYMLMGSDMLGHLSDWPGVNDLLARMQFLIGIRVPGGDEKRLIQTIQKTRGVKFAYKLFKSGLPEASSGQVRSELRLHKSSDQIPEAVLTYITEHKLYIPGDTDSLLS